MKKNNGMGIIKLILMVVLIVVVVATGVYFTRKKYREVKAETIRTDMLQVQWKLKDYIDNERPLLLGNPESEEQAVFISMKKSRMSVSAIERMVKKYAKNATPDKKISPHKMRSTYGTALYKDTGDIRLVSDVLGHKDINTTAKHYAAMEEEHRRIAATIPLYQVDEGTGE